MPAVGATADHVPPAAVQRGAAHVVRIGLLGAVPHHAAASLALQATAGDDPAGEQVVVAFDYDCTAIAFA